MGGSASLRRLSKRIRVIAPPGKKSGKEREKGAGQVRADLRPAVAPPDEPASDLVLMGADVAHPDGAGALAGFQPSRSLKRWILPVAVLGSPSTKAIQRGYFHTPALALTCSLRSSSRLLAAVLPGFSTMKALGLSRPSASSLGTTAASSTASWPTSALSTSNGDTQMPDTLNMSSVRPW